MTLNNLLSMIAGGTASTSGSGGGTNTGGGFGSSSGGSALTSASMAMNAVAYGGAPTYSSQTGGSVQVSDGFVPAVPSTGWTAIGMTTTAVASDGASATASAIGSSADGFASDSAGASKGSLDSNALSGASGGGPVVYAISGPGTMTSVTDLNAGSGVYAGSTANSEFQGFVAVRELPTLNLPAAQEAVAQLPDDTFQHSTESGGFQLTATSADGSPLPNWVHFDRSKGTFTLSPPSGTQADLHVVITAKDHSGHVASTGMHLVVAP
jgi:hypothetical protein